MDRGQHGQTGLNVIIIAQETEQDLVLHLQPCMEAMTVLEILQGRFENITKLPYIFWTSNDYGRGNSIIFQFFLNLPLETDDKCWGDDCCPDTSDYVGCFKYETGDYIPSVPAGLPCTCVGYCKTMNYSLAAVGGYGWVKV